MPVYKQVAERNLVVWDLKKRESAEAVKEAHGGLKEHEAIVATARRDLERAQQNAQV